MSATLLEELAMNVMALGMIVMVLLLPGCTMKSASATGDNPANGVTATVKVETTQFKASEPVKFVVAFNNPSDQAAKVSTDLTRWDILFKNVQGDDAWLYKVQPRSMAARIVDRTLQPGESAEVAFDSTKESILIIWGGEPKPIRAIPALKPGTYALTVTIPVDGGKVKTPPVEITIAP